MVESRTKKILSTVKFERTPSILVYLYGGNIAALFTYLSSQQSWFEEKGTLGRDGFFYKRPEDMSYWVGMSVYRITEGLKFLESKGLVVSRLDRKKGNNIKEYKVIAEKVVELYQSHDITTNQKKKTKKLLKVRDDKVKRYKEKEDVVEKINVSPEEQFFTEYQEYLSNLKTK